ncbi:GAF domain-containing protein [Nodosilinea sp. LEGE 07088]|uniref:LuxR C-terminal-related transcriptional regulator n=1 Tax=Nodosilinea sp. LEGE 07088 TaxID=2777968 RepID=UPI0018806E22|nr:LuxR C-terminal-related transcriptional regulator [Nodosilinea sp. LEGE 07088]MBE9138306.1 GAF domain-containing protein [Nodosilinea sp. LEGE 07088]
MASTIVSSAFDGVNGLRTDLPNQARLLLDLQRVNKIAQRLSGCFETETVARCITDGLVDQFSCAFARIWVVEPDQTALRLVASSGLYTHTNGAFARVPMGAYKVGKIAQNRVPFLSNRLAEEAWVKDRAWAIENGIQGFAGYPLMTSDRVIGVLATFSRSPMAAEFLEVLQVLCMTATIALDASLAVQAKTFPSTAPIPYRATLSDQLATILTTTTMALVGTETPLPASVNHIFVQLAELLEEFNCDYARLVYSNDDVALEALVTIAADGIAHTAEDTSDRWRSRCHQLRFMATCLGGSLQTQPGPQQQLVQITLRTPYSSNFLEPKVSIQCSTALVQVALTCMAYTARLTVCDPFDSEAVVITDSETIAQASDRVIWVRVKASRLPSPQAQALIDWTIDADQLRQVVQRISEGQPGGGISIEPGAPRPSEREQEIMALLAQGLRDRDIANHLYISESTVKFHINNSLTKLQAKNRYQAVYQAAIQGWI